jgi:hypothetical protein
MLARITAAWMIALVLCPFTAPFPSSDPEGLFGDTGEARSPFATFARGVAEAHHATLVAIVPPSRSREQQGARLLTSAPVSLTAPAVSAIGALGAFRGTAAFASERSASPVLRL